MKIKKDKLYKTTIDHDLNNNFDDEYSNQCYDYNLDCEDLTIDLDNFD